MCVIRLLLEFGDLVYELERSSARNQRYGARICSGVAQYRRFDTRFGAILARSYQFGARFETNIARFRRFQARLYAILAQCYRIVAQV